MEEKIVTLFKDSTKNEAYFPSTKVEAITDANGTTLGALLNQRVSVNDISGLNQVLTTGNLILSDKQYGPTLPTPGHAGRIFFRVAGTIPSAEEASF